MNEGARSFSGKPVGGDSYSITVNFKWLVQICTLIGGLLYGFWEIENRISTLENKVLEANNDIRSLITKHELEESTQRKELEEQVKWFQKELNLNPLSKKFWKKNER